MLRLVPIYFTVVIMSILIIAGCSGNATDPVSGSSLTPETPASVDSELALPIGETDASKTNRSLLGTWIMEFDPDLMNASIEPYRDTMEHIELTPLLPTPEIVFNSFDPVTKILDVDVKLTNPYGLSAYDLRLIIYTDSAGHLLMNQDGYTTLFDIQGGDFFNPFKAYAKESEFRRFDGHTDHTENLLIYSPNFFITFAIDGSFPGNCEEPYAFENFNHAVLYHTEGSLAEVEVEVYDWQDDIEHVFLHCPMINGVGLSMMDFKGDNTWNYLLENTLGTTIGDYTCYLMATSSNSGFLYLFDRVTITITEIDPPVWDDTVGVTDVKSVEQGATVYWGTATDELNPPVEYLVYMDRDFDPWDQTPVVVGTNDPYTFTGLDGGKTYWFGVRCQDSADPPNVETNQTVMSVDVGGWARSWGGFGWDEGRAITSDNLGNIYVTGSFTDAVDFDPGGEIELIQSNGFYDVFLSKFDPDGKLIWVRTWGGINHSNHDYEIGNGVACDAMGNVYVTGVYSDTVDFDPGDGVDDHVSTNLSPDVFISKLDPDGNYLWARTWGGNYLDQGLDIAVDDFGDVFVTGFFQESADFDPGPDPDVHTSNGQFDIFLSKFDSDGSYGWAHTWGGSSPDYDIGYGLDADSNGNVCVTGYFRGTADFDPGTGIDSHTSNGVHDIFLSNFDSSGGFLWANTWGGASIDKGLAIAHDEYNNIYATGWYQGMVDFDPGTGTDSYTSNGSGDVYLSKFDPDGIYLWGCSWGGSNQDSGNDLSIDSSGNICITGEFQGVVDFDPSFEVYERTSEGGIDFFLSKLSQDRELRWCRTKGGLDTDICYGITLNGANNIFLTGNFKISVDFSLGEDPDEHLSNGDFDAFLMKLLSNGYWDWL